MTDVRPRSGLWPGPDTGPPRWLVVGIHLGVPSLLTLLMLPLVPLGAFMEQWLLNAVVTSSIAVCVHLAYVVVEHVLRRRPVRPWARLPWHVAIFVGGTLAGSELATHGLVLLVDHDVASVRASIFRLTLFVSGAVGGLILLVHTLRARIHAAELRAELARRAALSAQLQAVQARTQPHFLFNSLNVIAALVEEDPPRAALVLEHLSALFRFAVDAAPQAYVPLRDERDAVRDYLAVEAARFGDRLRYDIDVHDDLGHLPVPPFVLQPLVENAVKHGLGSRPGPGLVRVSAARCADRLRLTVDDDGAGLGASVHQGSGTALRDLEERLHLLYAGAGALRTGPRPEGGVRAEVELPVAEAS